MQLINIYIYIEKKIDTFYITIFIKIITFFPFNLCKIAILNIYANIIVADNDPWAGQPNRYVIVVIEEWDGVYWSLADSG